MTRHSCSLFTEEKFQQQCRRPCSGSCKCTASVIRPSLPAQSSLFLILTAHSTDRSQYLALAILSARNTICSPRRGNELICPGAETYPTPLLTTLLNPCFKLVTAIITMKVAKIYEKREKQVSSLLEKRRIVLQGHLLVFLDIFCKMRD